MNFPVIVSFDDGINVRDGQFELNAILLAGLAVTSNPAKTVYRTGERISYSGLAVTAIYTDESTADVTSRCSITPPDNTEIDSDITAEISYSEGQDKQSATLQLTHLYLTGINITQQPDKNMYKTGEVISYEGLAVTASYSDGASEDITASCSISPAEGKSFDPDTDTNTEITYSEGSITKTAGFMLTEIYMTGLQVTSYPRKTAYKHDERISYAGLVVSANYFDGSSADVTSECDIIPKRNKKFDADTDSYVEISYSQGNNEASCTFSLTPITLTSLAVTSNPDNTVYSSGEPISYSGIVVSASYSDNSDDDVTEKCVFSPASGKPFSPDTDTTVTITYTEGQTEQFCTLTLTEATSMTLVVAAMPTKTNYNPGEPLDFTGVVIKSQFQDGTMHTVTDFCDFYPETEETQITVTAKCAHTAVPHAFDINKGYVDGSAWRFEPSSAAFSDVYNVKAGYKYLLTLGEQVGSRFKVMFTSTDVSKASADVTGTTITDISNPAIYESVEYTPSSNGYIVVTKDSNGNSGIRTYLYDADCSVKNVTTQFTLSTVTVTALAVTKPVKTRYRTGEKFDYTGAVVTATYSDGSVHNVTENASFSPVNGSTAVSDNPKAVVITQVIVSYGGLYAGFDVTMSGLAIMSLSVTPPNKISYRTGETVDYTGCKVMAVYWDGSEKDVTSAAVFEPANGTTVSKYDIDETNNLVVSISYQENDATAADLIEGPKVFNWEREANYNIPPGTWVLDEIRMIPLVQILTYQATYLDVSDGKEKTISFKNILNYVASSGEGISSEADYRRIVGEGFGYLKGPDYQTYVELPYTVYDSYTDGPHSGWIHNGQLGYYRDYVHVLIAIYDNVDRDGGFIHRKKCGLPLRLPQRIYPRLNS